MKKHYYLEDNITKQINKYYISVKLIIIFNKNKKKGEKKSNYLLKILTNK